MIRRRLIMVAVVGMLVAAWAQPALALSALPDPMWMTNGKLFTQTQVGNIMYLGGDFTQVRSTPAGVAGPKVKVTDLGAIDVTTGQGVTTFAPSIAHTSDGVTPDNAYVRAVAGSPDGTRLYIAGHFTSVDGVAARNVAAIDLSTGKADPNFAPTVGTATSTVFALLVSPDGSHIYIGGNFKGVNGVSKSNLGLLNSDGSAVQTWDPRANAQVHALTFATDGATVFVGGHFTTIDGVSRQSVARVDATTGELDAWAIPYGTICFQQSAQTAWSLVATPTRLLGGFGYKPNCAQSFRLDNGNTGSSAWYFGTVGNVQKVLLSDDGTQLFAGGHFGMGSLQQKVCNNTISIHGLLLFNAATGAVDCSWVPQLAPYGTNYTGVWDIDFTANHVWFAGGFTSVGGVSQQNVARVLK